MGFKQYLKEQEEQALISYENDKKSKLIDFVKTMDELNTDQFKDFAVNELGMTEDEAEVAVYRMLRDFLLAGEKEEPMDTAIDLVGDETELDVADDALVSDDEFTDELGMDDLEGDVIIADEEVIDEFARSPREMYGPHNFSDLDYEKVESFLNALGKPEKYGIDGQKQKVIMSILSNATKKQITSLNIIDKTFRDVIQSYSNDPTGAFMDAVDSVMPQIEKILGNEVASEMIDSEY